MYAKKVVYKGFDGKDVEEVVRLHLTKAEILTLDMKYSDYGGLMGYYRMLLTNMKEGEPAWKPLVSFLQQVILASYGKKTEEGKFIKKMNGYLIADEFETSEAYSALLLTLIGEDGVNETEAMLRGIFPADIDDEQLASEKKKLEAEFGL